MLIRSTSKFYTIILLLSVLTTPVLGGEADNEPSGARSVGDFLTEDGHFDLERARQSGFEGTLDLSGFRAWQDSESGNVRFAPSGASGSSRRTGDEYWQGGYGYAGLNGGPEAFAIFNGDLIVGGNLEYAGGTILDKVAKWDGTSWQAMGSDIELSINALCVFDSVLVAGGTNLSNDSFLSVIVWDGSTWSPVGTGVDGSVHALAQYGSLLIAGGNFSTAGGGAVNRIAAWDGSTWSGLGPGFNNVVSALCIYDSMLIAAGAFTNSGLSRIAAWDWASWSALGAGINSGVTALVVWDSLLIAGGNFSMAGGVPATDVAGWDGASWSAVGSGLTASSLAYSLGVVGSELYAGGDGGLEIWGGATWALADPEVFGRVDVITDYDSQLIVGGSFLQAGHKICQNIAVWADSTWLPIGLEAGLPFEVFALAVFDSNLVAGGEYSGVSDYIAIGSWNGSYWSVLGAGVNGSVTALVVYNSELIAAGEFDSAGGAQASHIASWNGTTWSSLGTGLGGSDEPHALTVYDSDLIIAGDLSLAGGGPVSNIAAWDGVSWSALGGGLNLPVHALTEYNNQLIAGGEFGGGALGANRIAAWDGAAWSPVDSISMSGTVYALAVYDSQLIIGGNIAFSLNSEFFSDVAAWNGTDWLNMGGGLSGPVTSRCNALQVYEETSQLIVCGQFDEAGGVDVDDVAAWNGEEWLPMGTAVGGEPLSLTVYESDLIMGGDYTFVGGMLSINIAGWNIPDQDGDGVLDSLDNCPSNRNGDQADADGDGTGDACDTCTDTDGDGFGDPGFAANTCDIDNCPDDSNPAQTDSDSDGVGDLCDACPGFDDALDADSDGVPDGCDICAGGDDALDADGDSVPDFCDACPGFDDFADSDGDTVPDSCDNCPDDPNPLQEDGDNDGIGDACACPVVITGDVDTSGALTSADIIGLVNFVFKSGAAPLPCVWSGDVNCSETVTSADIIYMVNHVFKGGPAPCDVCTLVPDPLTCP